MHVEIWDVATGNCIGRYVTAHEAGVLAQRLIDQFGTAYASDLEVVAEDDVGSFHGTRTGSELLAWVEEVLAEQPVTSTAGLSGDRVHAVPTSSD